MEKVIRKYYLSSLVNPNNKFDNTSALLSEKIEKLRSHFIESFKWKDKGHVVFLSHPLQARDILFNFFGKKYENKSPKFFTNFNWNRGQMDKISPKGVDFHLIDRLKEVENDIGFPDEIYWFSSSVGIRRYRDLMLDCMFLDRDSRSYFIVEVNNDIDVVDWADAFVFRMGSGVTIFGFRKEMNLEPVILGAGSVSGLDNKIYNLNKDFRSLESGTLNVPYLLGIERFYKYKIKDRRG